MEGLFERLERRSPTKPAPLLTSTTQEGSLRLLQIPSLHKTYLTRHEISEFLETLSSNAHSISELSLGNNSYSEQVILLLSQSIVSCRALSVLNLRGIFVSWDSQRHLESFSALCTSIESLSALCKLDLSANSLPYNSMDFFCNALPNTQHLQALYLDDNQIGSEGAAMLADTLFQNQNLKLTVFSIRNNNLGDLGVCRLANALASMNSLTKLNFALNKFGKTGLKSLKNTLHSNTKIRYLDLSDNFFNSRNSGRVIATALEPLQKLKFISLADCSLGNSCARAVVKAMMNCCKLVEANLEHNEIDSYRVTRKIVQFILYSQSLDYLNISGNDIDVTYVLTAIGQRKINLECASKPHDSTDKKYSEALLNAESSNDFCFFI